MTSLLRQFMFGLEEPPVRPRRVRAPKQEGAFLTIGELAEQLKLEQHVLRYWETKFPQIQPLKRAGGRRYYRPEDVDMVRRIQTMLYRDGFTIRGAQKALEGGQPVAKQQELPEFSKSAVEVPKSKIESLLENLQDMRRLIRS